MKNETLICKYFSNAKHDSKIHQSQKDEKIHHFT